MWGSGGPAVDKTATAIYPEPDLEWGRETLNVIITRMIILSAIV